MTRGHDAAERGLVTVRSSSRPRRRSTLSRFCRRRDSPTSAARLAGCAVLRHDALHHLQQFVRDARVDARARPRERTVDATQRHRTADAAGAEHRVRARQLQRRDRQARSRRTSSPADRAPVRVVVQQARRLAREAAARHLAEAEARSVSYIGCGLERHRHLRHADVARLREHGREVDRAEVVLVLE